MTSERWGYWSENVVRTVGDYRSQYWAGLIVRLVQGGQEKFFRITDVTFDGSYTYLTLSGGGMYTLSTDTITEHQHSPYLAPKGLPIGFDLLTQYLTEEDAEETFLKIDDAEETYLAKADAQGTYLSKSEAQGTYLEQSDHASTSLHTPGSVVPVVQSIPSSGGSDQIPSAAAVRSAVSEKLHVVGKILARSKGSDSSYGDYGVWINGTKEFTPGRSYGLVVVQRSNLEVVFSKTYDVYDSASNANALGNKMAEYDSDYIIVICTYDDPYRNSTTSPLPLQIARCGGSRTVFLSSGFQRRSAYALIGVPDIWEGGGFEAYSGSSSGDTLATCAVSVLVLSDGSIVKSTSW